MKELNGKVAVVTGAASGIGLAMAERFAAEGMKVVLSDIDEPGLKAASDTLRRNGATTLVVRTDVASATSVAELASKTVAQFGSVHVVANNAGVGGAPGPVWSRTLADWEWTFGPNLWGVIHGVHTFVPIMLEQKTEGHIINTASIAGLLSGPAFGVYSASKHAVVAISESLYYDLAMIQSQVKVSVLCPGYVKTRIAESGRLREDRDMGPVDLATIVRIQSMVDSGIPASEVAEQVVKAIYEERLYILTHPEMTPVIEARMRDLVEQKNPDTSALPRPANAG